MGAGGDVRMLDQTATWSVACVCAVIVIISVMLEHSLHTVGHFLKKRHKPGLMEALEKIKNELMVLGFISLLLVFSQNYIASICISKSLTKDFLPCDKQKYEKDDEDDAYGGLDARRRLLWNDHRRLAGDDPPKECDEGYEQIISVTGLHQLHIFIFFLAVFHVMYSTLTMIFGRAKTRKWKFWEREILADHVPGADPSKYRLTKDLSFVKHHTSAFANTPAMFYIVCFFRQFFTSVRRSDYMAMRHAFFSVHLSPGSHFNFQKYIKRSLEDDFKTIVGISPLLWANAVLFLFANVDGARVMTYLSIFPVIIILAVGTKLQAIVTQMAVEIQERQSVVQGIPVVELSDRHFWFSQPRLILYLIQLTLFQNSFEITHFFWIWYEFGLDTCFYESPILQYGRVIIGISVQCLCAYSILPLYALVTQMGSTMKQSIFDDHTSKALKSWHEQVKKKDKLEKTKTLGHPIEPPVDAKVKVKSSDSGTTVSSRPSANIVASVDIPDDKN
uniref:MLO-like protein 9 n=1 Tax=Erigeron canadensis TaxID=72917 RepID=UPI001CB9AAC8|nr:MLO-like protein 9 [Erigeron canadensis]